MSVGSYSNNADILAAMPSVGSATTITSATIAAFIGDAANEIEAALLQRFKFPLVVSSGATVPMLKTLNTRMALFDLITMRALANVSIDQQKSNPFYDRLKEARKFLETLASGGSELIDSTGVSVPQRTDIIQVWSNNSGYQPTFSEGDMEDNIQDAEKLTDDLAARGLLS